MVTAVPEAAWSAASISAASRSAQGVPFTVANSPSAAATGRAASSMASASKREKTVRFIAPSILCLRDSNTQKMYAFVKIIHSKIAHFKQKNRIMICFSKR